MSPKVAVVIVNWNGFDDTASCIESFRVITDTPYVVIVVDNGSTPSDANRIKSRFPDCIVIESDVNLGFAGGCNLGIEAARNAQATHVFLFNNDAEVVSPELMSRLLEDVASRGNNAMAAPLIVYADNPGLCWFAGGKVSLKTASTAHVGFNLPADQFSGIRETAYVTGCALMTPIALIDRIGPIPEEYFLYFEETDWNLRARQAGASIICDRDCRVVHKTSRSMKRAGDVHYYYFLRSRLTFAKRWCGPWYYVILPLTLGKASVVCAYNMLRRRERRANLIRRAIADFFAGRSGKLIEQ